MPAVQEAGAIATRKEGDTLEVLLVKARKDPSQWIFPKGHIEPGETAAEAAVRELQEEAGVIGEALYPVGTSTFRSGDEDVEVTYFLARLVGTKGAPERPVRWCELSEARALLTFNDARQHLDRAVYLLRERHP